MKTTKQQPENRNPEPPKKFLDPNAEWRDHANQWDLSAWQSKPASTPPAPKPDTSH